MGSDILTAQQQGTLEEEAWWVWDMAPWRYTTYTFVYTYLH